MEFIIDGLVDAEENERHITIRRAGSRNPRLVLSTGIVGGNVYEAELSRAKAFTLARAIKALMRDS